MKKTWKRLLLFIGIIFGLSVPLTAHADVGPKPSVHIRFKGIEGETYYGTLLANVESTGPYSAWNGVEEDARCEEGKYDIWKKFVEYKDEDGFYFLQEFWDCTESNQLSWTYRPPETFKILLYFPEKDTFYISPIYDSYAFDSYYTVDMSDYVKNGLIAEETYDYTGEMISLVVRIIITILLELAIALLFGYRERNVLKFFAVVNVITQILLNVLLNIVNYHAGFMAFTLSYVLFEIIVFIIEAFIYRAKLYKFNEKQQSKFKAVLYALTANAASFIVGFWISYHIPGIF